MGGRTRLRHTARRTYDAHVGRSYSDARVAGKTAKDCVPASLTTESVGPLVIVCDVTGSMGDWPATMFSKLPYLDHEAGDYLGSDKAICFAAVGDANGDEYPLQVQQFGEGAALKKALLSLIIEGHGGGQIMETYELAALYFARNVAMPKAVSPILIFIGDEAPYDVVIPEQAEEFAHVALQKRLRTKDIFDELMTKFSVYLVRKPYHIMDGNAVSDEDRRIHRQWANLIGEDRIADLPVAERVVDVIFGILAKEADRVDDFRKEIEDRQRPDQVRTVYKSLETIHRPKSLKKLPAGRSVLHRTTGGDRSKPML